MSRRRRRRETPQQQRRRNYLAAFWMLAAIVLATYFAFHPSLPFRKHFELRAVVTSANQLRANSPVRIAGVDVGKVTGVDRGPGNTSTIVMTLDRRALPLHRDASMRIRSRLFLEGGFYVELQPGSPNSPTVHSDWTMPLSQTATPVQLHQVLAVFDKTARGDIRTSIGTTAKGVFGGGAEGLRAAAPQLAPALRDAALATRALQGSSPKDLSRALGRSATLTQALAANPGALAGLVKAFNSTAATLADHDGNLAGAIRDLDSVLRTAPASMRDFDAALPETHRALVSLSRALPEAPSSLDRTLTAMSELNALVAPGAREVTVGSLATVFRDLPILTGRLAGMFPSAKQLSDCLRTHIIPTMQAQAPDGALSTGRPVWQDFVHALVGLAGASQDFDGNGFNARYMFGTGPELISTQDLPRVGKLIGSIGAPLNSRPIPLGGGRVPPLRSDVSCSDQPVPKLATPAGSSGFLGAGPANRTTATVDELIRKLEEAQK